MSFRLLKMIPRTICKWLVRSLTKGSPKFMSMFITTTDLQST